MDWMHLQRVNLRVSFTHNCSQNNKSIKLMILLVNTCLNVNSLHYSYLYQILGEHPTENCNESEKKSKHRETATGKYHCDSTRIALKMPIS